MSSGKRLPSFLWTEWKLYFFIAILSISVNENNANNSYASSGYYQRYGNYWVPGEQCTRECWEGDTPRYCYWHFTVEHYTSMNAACDYNKPWSGEMTYNKLISTKSDGCVLLDGKERSFLIINRKAPMSIQVCKNDFVIVDVDNKTPKHSFTLHWHGIEQQNTQYFDGVPYVTQCPIMPEQTFRYMFRANLEGTYYWHSHVDAPLSAPGALIVRQPPTIDPLVGLYEMDLPEHVLLLHDILAEYKVRDPPSTYRHFVGETPDNIFINGYGRFRGSSSSNLTDVPYASYAVKDGLRYRFRMIDAMATVCLVRVYITNHPLQIIALDGQPVTSKNVDSIILSSGERVDFVVDANCKDEAQWIVVLGQGECAANGIYQLAIMHCEEGPDHPSYEINSYQDAVGYEQTNGVLFSPIDTGCVNESPNAVCTTSLQYAGRDDNEINLNQQISSREPDVTLVLVLDFRYYDAQTFFKMNETVYFVAPGRALLSGTINEEIFRGSVPPRIITMKEDPYYRQKTPPLVFRLARNKLVRVINIDSSCTSDLQHPVHKHGGHYSTILTLGVEDFPESIRNASWQVRGSYAIGILKEQKRTGTFNTNAPKRDTMAIPHCGVVVYQFYTYNPGPWLMHCHFAWHHVTGMSAIFEVGGPEDIPPVPPNFPKCDNFKPGPDYVDFINYLDYNSP